MRRYSFIYTVNTFQFFMFENVVAALGTFAFVTFAKDEECYMLSSPSRFDYSILVFRVSGAN